DNAQQLGPTQRVAANGDERRGVAQSWNGSGEVCAESDSQGGDSTGVVNGEDHPAIQESDEVAVGFSQVEIRSAGLGIHRAELGKSQTAEHGDSAADHPDSDEECRCVKNRGNVPGS